MKYLAAILALFPSIANAQARCLSQDPAPVLSEKYGEKQFAQGIRGNGLMRFYLDPEDGSWTLVLDMGNGVFCMMLDGTDFELVKAKPETPEES